MWEKKKRREWNNNNKKMKKKERKKEDVGMVFIYLLLQKIMERDNCKYLYVHDCWTFFVLNYSVRYQQTRHERFFPFFFCFFVVV